MQNHKKPSTAARYRFLLIVPMALSMILSVNARSLESMTVTITTTLKDSVKTLNKSIPPKTGSNLQSTNYSLQQPDKEGIYNVIDQMPEFPGGEKALLDYIARNLKYPIETQRKGIQGKIIVRFVVNKSGKVENAKVIRGLEENADAEGLRVINSLPDWIPGSQKGKKVSVYYVLPISYKLTGNSNSSALDPKKKPVFILDGKVLPVDFILSTINRDSIQSVDVLKPDTDAKKAELIAKYGEQAANGVIVITKKK